MEQVLELLDSIVSLEPGLRDYLTASLRPTRPRKKETLVREGDIARNIGFIEKGLIRGYMIREDGSEFTKYFMQEGDIFISVDSFFSQTAATEILQSLESCIIYSITYQQLQYALAKWPSFKDHKIHFLQKYYRQSLRREEIRARPDYDRIAYLMEHYSTLADRVADKYLASFLDMTPAYYSAVKNEYLRDNPRR